MTRGCTSGTVWMAVSSIYDASKPTPRRRRGCSKTFSIADDAALFAHTERALQRVTSCFADASRLFGLEVSLKKTEVLHQPAPNEEYRPPHISISGTELKTTQQLTYLGCTISSDGKIDNEIDNRLAKANSSFVRLYKRVWNNKNLKSKTKIRV